MTPTRALCGPTAPTSPRFSPPWTTWTCRSTRSLPLLARALAGRRAGPASCHPARAAPPSPLPPAETGFLPTPTVHDPKTDPRIECDRTPHRRQGRTWVGREFQSVKSRALSRRRHNHGRHAENRVLPCHGAPDGASKNTSACSRTSEAGMPCDMPGMSRRRTSRRPSLLNAWQ